MSQQKLKTDYVASLAIYWPNSPMNNHWFYDCWQGIYAADNRMLQVTS